MQKPSMSTLIPILIIVSIIAGGLFFLFKPQNDSIRSTVSPPQTSPIIPDAIDKKQSEDTTETTFNPEPQGDSNNYRRAPMEITTIDPCLETIKQLDSFFLYLDGQDYIKAYQFPNGSKEFIASMVNKALSRPPTPKLELRFNGAHLYRTIGGQNLLILAKILTNEPDHLETVFENFYKWSLTVGRQCQNRTYSIRPQLNQLYKYALFFLDSGGGKSYVNRRESMTGLLTRFYAIQIIKEAKAHHIDTYSTDLSLDISTLITDIESSDLLEHKTSYLKALYTLRDQ